MTMTDTLGPGTLVAELPYALGFYPTTETVVVVSDTDRRRLWDFPPDRSAVDVAAAIAKRGEPTQTRVTPVVYAERVGFSVELDAHDLATALSAHFAHVDAPVIVTPDGWRHAVDCPTGCCSPNDALNPAVLPADLAHEAATSWPTPLAKRADLVDYFTPDPLRRTLLTAARTPAARQERAAILAAGSPAAWRHAAVEQAWTQRLTSLRRPSPVAAARTLLQLQDTAVADAILMRIVHDPTPTTSDHALIESRNLCHAAPADLAPAALSTWAHAAACCGDSQRAMAAIHQTQQLSPRHHATSVLRRLLLDGVEPADPAAVHLPEDSLLNTPTGISPAVVSTAPGARRATPTLAEGPLDRHRHHQGGLDDRPHQSALLRDRAPRPLVPGLRQEAPAAQAHSAWDAVRSRAAWNWPCPPVKSTACGLAPLPQSDAE